MAQDKDRRTEKPTGRQLRKARDKGNVARSQDIGHAVSLAIFLGWSALAGAAFMGGLTGALRAGIANLAASRTDGMLLDALLDHAWRGLALIGPLVLAIALAAIAAQLLQTGWHLRKPLFQFDLKKLDPVAGLRGFINLQKLVQALKALLKIGIYAALAAFVVVPEWDRVLDLGHATPGEIFGTICGITLRVLMRALLVSAVIAAADFAISRRIWYRNLYMTKQQVRDEHRENEGDPAVKARIRSKMREAIRRRMMSAVKTADVVVTNPTHVAVALRYERKTMAAPVVVAKGRGFVALRIREQAELHRVPLLEDPPLARTLERLCPLGAPIPPALYRAVAEVLAYVLGRRRGAYRPHHDVESLVRHRAERPGGARP